MKPTILNASILTSFGSFDYTEISLEEAQEAVKDGFDSAVGHQSTCEVLSALLGVNVPLNRVQYEQKTGDIALVFKLNGRPEEGKILTAEEIHSIGFSFGLLVKK